MRLRWVGALLVLASCGKVAGDDAITSGDDPQIDSGISYEDAGKQAQDASPHGSTIVVDSSVPASTIDSSTWSLTSTTSSCSFEFRYDEENAPPYFVTGTRVIARIMGTEIPYVGFGCTGAFGPNGTATFIGGTASYDGQNNPQWAYVDIDGSLYSVDDAHISECDLSENAASLGTIGSEVSGTFSCLGLPGSPAPITITNGKYDTVFSNDALTLP